MSDDYHSIIARAVSRLPNKTDEARTAIYERARAALRETLHNCDPPLSEAEIANVQTALDAAIGAVEEGLLLSDMRRFVKEETLSPPSFISKIKELVRSVADKFKVRQLGCPGRSPLWLMVKNPKAPAVKCEADEDWGC